jgi:hypothetical protein
MRARNVILIQKPKKQTKKVVAVEWQQALPSESCSLLQSSVLSCTGARNLRNRAVLAAVV